MTEEFEDALRKRVEEAVDREVEHLRSLLELRLNALVREVLAERLPTSDRLGTGNGGLELPGPSVGSSLACRDDDGNNVGGASHRPPPERASLST